jgi:antitoxin component of MazEF toxin-antitoxin module
MAIRTKLRRVGDSVGVILPKRELELRRLKEGDEVEIPSVHKVAPRDLFGVWKERPARVGEAGA